MAPPDPPEDASRSKRGEEGIVRPDELDYTASERVAELDDNRYVVATDNDSSPSADDSAGKADSLDERGDIARQQMARYVSDRETEYGFVLTAAFDGEIDHHEHFADDVEETFGELVTWYIDQIDTNTPSAEVLGILLLASETRVSFPSQVLVPVLRRHGLGLDDSIADLVEALSGTIEIAVDE